MTFLSFMFVIMMEKTELVGVLGVALLFMGQGYCINYFPLIAASNSGHVVVNGVFRILGNVRQSQIYPLVLISMP